MSELGDHEFFGDVRGRGARTSLEYRCAAPHLFGTHLASILAKDCGILISGKWHRLSFSHALNVTPAQVNKVVSATVETFKRLASVWTKDYFTKLGSREYF